MATEGYLLQQVMNSNTYICSEDLFNGSGLIRSELRRASLTRQYTRQSQGTGKF